MRDLGGFDLWTALRRLRLPTGTALRLLSSFVLALLLWGWVTERQDPFEPRTFTNVPLEEPQVEPPLQIVDDLSDVAVRVVVEGPRSIVQDLVDDELKPQLDLSQVGDADTYTVPVRVSLPNGVRVDRITPRQLTIQVDATANETFRLDPVVIPFEDDSLRIGEIVPDVTEVTVSGPQQIVAEVAQVVLPVEIGERTSDFTATIAPQARNRDEEPIAGVQIQPERVAAQIPVEAQGRRVPVLIQTAGAPAQGYEVVDRVANPDMVVLDGPPALVDEVVSISTAPIGIEGAMEQVSRSVGLAALPPGVTVVEPADGNVEVVIQIRPRGTTQPLTDQAVTVTDLAPGLTTAVEPAAVDVEIFASEDTLAALEAGDIVPRASVAGLGPGRHRVALEVSVPAGVQWLTAEPETVLVTITAGGTPAATPTSG